MSSAADYLINKYASKQQNYYRSPTAERLQPTSTNTVNQGGVVQPVQNNNSGAAAYLINKYKGGSAVVKQPTQPIQYQPTQPVTQPINTVGTPTQTAPIIRNPLANGQLTNPIKTVQNNGIKGYIARPVTNNQVVNTTSNTPTFEQVLQQTYNKTDYQRRDTVMAEAVLADPDATKKQKKLAQDIMKLNDEIDKGKKAGIFGTGIQLDSFVINQFRDMYDWGKDFITGSSKSQLSRSSNYENSEYMAALQAEYDALKQKQQIVNGNSLVLDFANGLLNSLLYRVELNVAQKNPVGLAALLIGKTVDDINKRNLDLVEYDPKTNHYQVKQNMVDQANERVNNKGKLAQDLVLSGANQLVNYAIEMFVMDKANQYMKQAGTGLTKKALENPVIQKAMNSMAVQYMWNFSRRVLNNQTYQGLTQFLRNAGFTGLVGEQAEEELQHVTERYFDQLLNNEELQLKPQLMSNKERIMSLAIIGVMGSAPYAAGAVSTAAYRNSNIKDVKDALQSEGVSKKEADELAPKIVDNAMAVSNEIDREVQQQQAQPAIQQEQAQPIQQQTDTQEIQVDETVDVDGREVQTASEPQNAKLPTSQAQKSVFEAESVNVEQTAQKGGNGDVVELTDEQIATQSLSGLPKEANEVYREVLGQFSQSGNAKITKSQQMNAALLARYANRWAENMNTANKSDKYTAMDFIDNLDIVVDAAQADIKNNGYNQVAYHGTPHIFDTIKTNIAIGAGRGRNAHGDGFYTAKNKSVAERYRQELAKNGETGQILELEIPENNELLDENKLLRDQSENVKKALSKLRDTKMPGSSKTYGDIVDFDRTGREIYYWLSDGIQKGKIPVKFDKNDTGSYTGEQIANRLLEKYGIKGISYIGQRDGRSFVVFDPKNVQILHRYNQQTNEKIKGQAVIDQAQRVIKLFETADESTFAHELGHIALTDLKTFAEMDGATQQQKQDWQTVANWVDYKPNQKDFTVKQQEKFAQGFEAWLRTGETQITGLRGVFRRFSEWLGGLYKTYKELGGKPPQAVRNVMERMLATQSEIEQAANDKSKREYERLHSSDYWKNQVRKSYPKASREFVSEMADILVYMQDGMGQGVTTALTYDQTGQNVTGRLTSSNNDLWYQEWYEAEGRKPNKGEQIQIAYDMLTKGDYTPTPLDEQAQKEIAKFRDLGGEVIYDGEGGAEWVSRDKMRSPGTDSEYLEAAARQGENTDNTRTIKADKDSLPVKSKTGKKKASRLEARLTEGKDNVDKVDAKELLKYTGQTYDTSTNKEQLEKAAQFIEKDPEGALAALLGARGIPSGTTRGALLKMYGEYALINGREQDYQAARALTSVVTTRMGQEIQSLSLLSEDDPINQINQIQNLRIEEFAKKNKSNVEAVKKTIEKKTSEYMSEYSKELKRQTVAEKNNLESLLKEIIC